MNGTAVPGASIRRGTTRWRCVAGCAVAASWAALVLPAGAAPAAKELAASVTPLSARVETLDGSPTIRAIAPPVRDGGTTVPADVLFGFDRAAVRSSGRRALVRLAAPVADRSGTLRVVGHTDAIGAPAHNRRLSVRRARAVAAILRAGLPSTVQITASGRGARDPVADETTADGRDDPDGRARNRRVELRFAPGGR